MKKTAVLIYDHFCNFEFSVMLEMLSMAEKDITIFAQRLTPIRSEEGLRVVADKTLDQLHVDEYDSLILTGAADIRSAMEDEAVMDFIRQFDDGQRIIGAISIAPVLLLKAGLLDGKRFMAGVNPEELMEEGFTAEDLAKMVGWDQNLDQPIADGYIQAGNIITSISYNFIRWSIAVGKAMGIPVYPKAFGVED